MESDHSPKKERRRSTSRTRKAKEKEREEEEKKNLKKMGVVSRPLHAFIVATGRKKLAVRVHHKLVDLNWFFNLIYGYFDWHDVEMTQLALQIIGTFGSRSAYRAINH